GAEQRLQPADEPLDGWRRLGRQPVAEPAVRTAIEHAEPLLALGGDRDRARAAIRGERALRCQPARHQARHDAAGVAEIEIEPVGEPREVEAIFGMAELVEAAGLADR